MFIRGIDTSFGEDVPSEQFVEKIFLRTARLGKINYNVEREQYLVMSGCIN